MDWVLSKSTNVQHELCKKPNKKSGFVQLGHDVAAIIGIAYPGFGFGGILLGSSY